MKNRRFSLVPPAFALLCAGTAFAQTLPANAQSSPAAGTQAAATAGAAAGNTAATRTERAVERLRIQDAGSRIDELRVGGETQSISVKPAGEAPAYEVRPATSATQEGAGSRFWNVLKF